MNTTVLQPVYRHRGPLLLINPDHPLSDEPSQHELYPIPPKQNRVFLERQTSVMLTKLLSEIGADGRILPVSGFRTLQEQQQLYAHALHEHGRAFTEQFVAKPHCSEHQSGLAVDLARDQPEIDPLCPEFPTYGICGLFRNRAAAFGFIVRYPRGKESVTKIGYEHWHFRYVGFPHSVLIQRNGLCLEEYLTQLKQYPAHGKHLQFMTQRHTIEIYFLPLSGPVEEAELPTGFPCQVSGNNQDGAVVT